MSQDEDRLTALETQVTALQAQLAALQALEQYVPQDDASKHALGTSSISKGSGKDLIEQTEPSAVQGTLLYSGQVQLYGMKQREQRQTLAAVFKCEPQLLAPIFAAFASSHRIVMLRMLFQGPCTGQQLAEGLGLGSTGQLYHHIKKLLAVRLIQQRGRSFYGIDPAKAVPIGIALMAASHLMPSDWRQLIRDHEANDQDASSKE